MRFSERIGKKSIKCDMQIESMDKDLRNRLWNIIWIRFVEKLKAANYAHVDHDYREPLRFLWHEFFKWPIHNIPTHHAPSVNEIIRGWFYKAEWYEVYDLLEFLAGEELFECDETFRKLCNNVLEKEVAGYRFVGKHITLITSKVEIDEINQALETTEDRKFKGIKVHLESALSKLSDKENPDYRNSIKESISAVESVCILITKNKKATLGEALKIIRDAKGLHPALEKGFSAIYGYTSNAGGIRHAMTEESDCNFEDAKYMLVSCSAFVNYLLAQADKGNLMKD